MLSKQYIINMLSFHAKKKVSEQQTHRTLCCTAQIYEFWIHVIRKALNEKKMSINFHLSSMQFSIPCSHKIHREILKLLRTFPLTVWTNFPLLTTNSVFMLKNVLQIKNMQKKL